MRLTTKLLGATCGAIVGLAAGCSNNNMDNTCTPDQASGMTYQYATNQILLPSATNSFAIDIDGDGRNDNQLKAIVSAVSAAMFDLQGPVNDAVANGTAVILAAMQTADLTMGCSKVTLNLAQAPAMGAPKPKFDGTDKFTINTAAGQTPAVLGGMITGGKLSSILPKDQRGDQVQKIILNLPLAMGVLPLVIYGAHISGTITADKIATGEIHGVILQKDINEQIIPAVAQLLTDQIHKDPTSGTTDTIVRLFEDPVNNPASKAKCMVAADCCQLPANRPTCKITADEVKSNALIGNVLAADVQVMQNGAWNPVPKGTAKDAMSVGLGFTSVKASF